MAASSAALESMPLFISLACRSRMAWSYCSTWPKCGRPLGRYPDPSRRTPSIVLRRGSPRTLPHDVKQGCGQLRVAHNPHLQHLQNRSHNLEAILEGGLVCGEMDVGSPTLCSLPSGGPCRPCPWSDPSPRVLSVAHLWPRSSLLSASRP